MDAGETAMRQTCGAIIALAIFGILLVGPLYVAVTTAEEQQIYVDHCNDDMGCEEMPSAD